MPAKYDVVSDGILPCILGYFGVVSGNGLTLVTPVVEGEIQNLLSNFPRLELLPVVWSGQLYVFNPAPFPRDPDKAADLLEYGVISFPGSLPDGS